MAKRDRQRKNPVTPEATSPDVIDELDYEYAPSEADGDMFGGAPAKKAQHFWPSAKRLLGLLRPERAKMTFVVLLVIISVVFTVIAPKVLGEAMDVIFNGVLGAQMPAGVPLDEVIAGLRAEGNDQFADMLQGTTVVPGEGIDFIELSRLIFIVLGLYLVASFLMWAQGFILNGLVMRIVYKLRQDIEEKLNRLPLSYFDTRQRGDLMSRVTNDVDNVQAALQQAFSQLVQSRAHGGRHRRHDVHRVVAAGAHRADLAAALGDHRRRHRRALPEALRRPVEEHRFAERAHRGDLLWPGDRAGVRSRQGDARGVRQSATTSSTRPPSVPSSSPA